jgi:hypothetical protein
MIHPGAHLPVEAALRELCAGLLPVEGCLRGVEGVERAALPPAFRPLLDHHDHMTDTLRTQHGDQVALEVLREQNHAEEYARLIRLRLAGPRRVVEVGIARLELAALDPAVRGEVDARRTPLGDILARHDVLRSIAVQGFMRLSPENALVGWFDDPGIVACYGRVGTISIAGRPAIRLLEVVIAPTLPPRRGVRV